MSYLIDKNAKCAVIGDGSWATAIVKILLENEHTVGWYVRRHQDIACIKRRKRNPNYLSDVHLPTSRLAMSSDINEVIADADIIILAVPSVYFKTTIEPLNIDISGKFFVSAIKGIVPGEYVTIAEFINRRYGVPFEQMGVVTGPCHAEEVALERISYLTIFCKSNENCVELGNRFKTKYINVSYSNDIYGAEYAPVLKNVYALAVGIVVGLGYGDNFIAVLISNSAMEMTRFMDQSYPAGRDMNASAYLGDLLVTAYSKFSRNRAFGLMIGKGYSVSSARIEMNMVAEGYYAAECICHINRRYGVSMPILDAVYKILYKGENAEKTVKNLIKKLR